MDMFGYGPTEQGNYFYIRGQYKFFYCSYVFFLVFPLLFFIFFHGWIVDEICGNADEMLTSEECVGEPPPPLTTSLLTDHCMVTGVC